MQRNISGPDRDWLTLDEAAAWMGLDSSTLKRLIRKGQFPPGVKVSPKCVKWGWLDVVAYMHLVSRMPEKADDDEKDEEK